MVPNNAFFYAFSGCSYLTSIPSNLFSHITTAGAYSFYNAFAESGLTSIPDGLFSSITDVQSGSGSGNIYGGTFQGTFRAVPGLTSLPAGLWSGITGATPNMFQQAFYNCSNLGGYIPPDMFAGLIANGSPDANASANGAPNMWGSAFSGTQILTECPAGTINYITNYEDDWGYSQSNYPTDNGLHRVSCEPCPTGYTSNAARTACVPQTSAVTLNANGGTNGSTTSVTATYDAAMPGIPAANLPTRAGYTFVGFYDTDAATGGTQYYTSVGASARTWDKIGNQTLYARWTQCAANSYCPGDNTSVTCTSATSNKYTKSAAGSTSINDCYLTLAAGQRVATAGAGASVCGSNTYSTSTANIYYGGTSTSSHPTTSSCESCTSGYTTSGAAASNHDAASDCSITITLKKNGSTGTIQGTGGTNDASVTCQEGVPCNFGSASDLVPTSGGYTMTGGWGTANSCSAITASFTTPTTTTYYACKSTCSYTNSTVATPSSNVCAGTCKTGYSTSGGSNTGTAASCSGTACTCSPKTFTVTLDDNSGSGGSGTIYTTYNTNVYKDSGRSNAMTSSANPVTKPSKPSGYKFLGYYNSSNGTTQYIDENGYITSAGLSAGKALTANGTWYARYESMSVAIPIDVSHTYDGTAKSCDGDIDVVVPASGATVTYTETSGGTYSTTMPTITNPGEKTIYFKVSAPGYTDYYGSYWCTMNRLTLTPTSGTITYPTATTTFTAACTSGGPVTVSSRNTGVATVSKSSTPTNGAYTVTVTWVAAGSDNNTASTVIDVNCTEQYESEGDEEIESIYAPVSGTYSITTAKGDSTTTVKDGSKTVTNATSTIVNGTYGTNKTLTATCSSGATPTVASATTTVATASISNGTITLTPVKAGDSVITVTCPATAGYKSSTSTFTYRVARTNGTTTLSATADTITYPTTTTTFTAQCSDNAKPTATSATEAVATVAVSSTATNNKYTVTVTWKAAGSGNNTASSVITVTCPQTDHYKESSSTYTATTAKGNGSTTLSDTSSTLTYNGTSAASTTNTFTAKCADGVKPTATSSNTNAATVAVSSSADANGNYTITNTWVGAGTDDNTATSTISVSCAAGTHYKSSSATHTLTTAKKANTLTLSASSGTVTYPEASKTFTISTNTSSGTLSISSNSDSTVATASLSGTIVTMTPKKSGSTTITVASAATDYYKSATATYTLTVADKTITINKNNGTGSCGGATGTNAGSMTCTYAADTCTAPTWNSTSCSITNGSGTSSKVLIGWTANSTSGTTIALGGDAKNVTSLYAKWGTPTCTVTDTNSATCVIATTSNNRPTATYTCKSGYHYGTNESTTSATLYATAGQVSTAVSGTCTGNTISLSYANGGHGTAPTTPASCTYGANFTTPAAMTATGYTFSKWSVNSKTFSASTSTACNYTNLGVYSGSATLTGTWTANVSGAITLDSKYYASDSATSGTNAGTNAAPTPLYSKYASGIYSNSAATTAVPKLTTIPAYTTYVFGGFYTGKAGTGTQVIDAAGTFWMLPRRRLRQPAARRHGMQNGPNARHAVQGQGQTVH
jgi:uncharacterized repeat protein (TIGR02543 family)